MLIVSNYLTINYKYPMLKSPIIQKHRPLFGIETAIHCY